MRNPLKRCSENRWWVRHLLSLSQPPGPPLLCSPGQGASPTSPGLARENAKSCCPQNTSSISRCGKFWGGAGAVNSQGSFIPIFLRPWVFCPAQFSSVQSLSRVWLFATPWIAARQASLSITNSQSSLKFMSIKLVMPSSHLILCCPLLLLLPTPSSIRVFSNESSPTQQQLFHIPEIRHHGGPVGLLES